MGKISSAVGSATIRAVDSVFTAGEVVVENAKKTTVGKVRNQYVRLSSFDPMFSTILR